VRKNKQKTFHLFYFLLKNYSSNIEHPFIYCCSSKHTNLEVISLLLENKINVNLKNKQMIDGLSCVLKYVPDNIEIVKLLIESKADLKSRNNRLESSFHYLCNYSFSIEKLKIFVDNKCEINLQEEKKNTGFHFHFKNKKDVTTESVKEFLINKADPNLKDQYSNTPFHLFCLSDFVSLELTKLFIDYSCDLNLIGYNKQGIFHFLSLNNSKECFKILEFLCKEKKILPDIKKTESPTPLHLSFENTLDINKIKFLLDLKFNPNTKNNQGETSFHLLTKNNKNVTKEIIELLFEYKADINIKAKSITPIFNYAKSGDSLEILKLLAEKTSDLNLTDTINDNLLYYAIHNSDFVKFLIENKVDINNLNKSRCGILDSKISNRCVDLDFVKFLLQNKADPNLYEYYGRSIFHSHIVSHFRNYDVIDLMIEYKGKIHFCFLLFQINFLFLLNTS
jgi:ankyrin repeat protein